MIIAGLDGVFADFTGAAASIHGKWATKIEKWDFFKDWGLTADQFWDKIHLAGDDFYKEQVLPYPWAKELLLEIQKTDEFIIMTSPSNNPYGYSGKKIWIDKYLQPFVLDPIRIVVGSDKWLLANPDAVLIDDYDVNIHKFAKAGGFTITYPQLWNNAQMHASNGMFQVKRELKLWKEKQLSAKQREAKQREVKQSQGRSWDK